MQKSISTFNSLIEYIFYKSKKIGSNKNLYFLGFLLIYSLLLLYLCIEINISEDEAYTLNTTSHKLMRVISQSYHFEGQPPMYFLLLSLWRHIDHSILFAKLFSLLFTGLSAYVFYRLSVLISGTESVRWMVVIFLLNPFTVWAALEMRTYSLLIFLSTSSIYFFFRFYISKNNKHLIFFLIVCLIGIYTQYFFTLLVTAFALSILIFKGWNAFFKFCLYLIPLALLFLPNLFFLPDQIALHEINESKYPGLFKILTVFKTPQNLILAVNIVPFSVWLNRGIRVIFVCVAVLAYLKLIKKKNTVNNSFSQIFNLILISVIILVTLFSIVVSVTGIGYTDKYMSIVFPLLILLFSLFRILSPFNRNLFFSIVTIYYLLILISNYRHPVKTYDFKSLSTYINKIGQSREPILFYRSAIALPFVHYYNGPNKIVPLPHPVRFDSSYLLNIKDTFELKKLLENIKTFSKSYLLISDTTIYEGTLNMNRKLISEYIDHHYKVTLDTLFYGWSKAKPLRIKRLEKK